MAHTHVCSAARDPWSPFRPPVCCGSQPRVLSDLCAVPLCAFQKASVVAVPVFGVCLRRHLRRGRRCCGDSGAFHFTRVYVADAGTAEKPWSVMSDIRTYTCVFHTHRVCGHGSGLWCVCQWCLVTQTCVFATGRVAMCPSHLTRMCAAHAVLCRDSVVLRTHMCLAEARNPWLRFRCLG